MIKNMLLSVPPLYSLCIGVGYFFSDKKFEEILFLSIFCFIGLLFFTFILSLFLSQKIEVKITGYKSGKNGMPNMTPVGGGKIYTLTYTLKSVEYKETISYSSMTKYNIGDMGIAYKHNKLIVLQGDLFKLSYFAIFPIVFSLILLLQ